MTLDNAILELRELQKGLPTILSTAVSNIETNLTAKIRTRIFSSGKNSNNQAIGEYSTKTWYVPRPGKPSFMRGKPIVLKWVRPEAFIPDSPFGKEPYMILEGTKEFREIQNLRGDTVLLDYTGELKESFVVKVETKKDYSSIMVGFTDADKAILAYELEDKYKRSIFMPTYEEELSVQQTLTSNIFNALSSYGF